MPDRTTPTQPDFRDEGACRPPVRPGPTVENITRGVSNMRAHSDGGDDNGGRGDDADERFMEDVEAGDDDDDIRIRPPGKTGGRGKGRSTGAVHGPSVGHGDRGGANDDSGKSATYWSSEDQMLLVRCKREQDMHLVGLGHNYGRMRTKEWKWDDTAKRMRSRRSMSTRGSARGKKRDEVPDDSQGQGRGRRHVPKAKRVHSDDASARVPPRGVQGWAAVAEADYDKDFTTEEERAEATVSAVRESGRQRSSDHIVSKRMLTPSPEAQQLRARETRTEKAVVVDLGGDDGEPLEKCRLRTRTTTTPPPTAVALAAVDERPVTGRLPAMPSQPRRRNQGDDGGSVQRGGGGKVVADARKVGGEPTGGACAGASITVAPVVTAREEAAVVVMAREEACGEKKNDREGGEPGSSRVRRGVMTKDLIDRAVLWVDDKAFWMTGSRGRGEDCTTSSMKRESTLSPSPADFHHLPSLGASCCPNSARG
ncbi:hypothetical protein CBR_g52147 [Chara braunii]|uniref:Myb-like domain-containing protein n=1 Tax=Chara braunii TaxID=69332 RepID=A0A388M9X0_CHABU|nr:hypothetical protein CBR_g52147 [Chara braunii]|eukprot:GBG91262.1 hypothetical protein CBR_g52147 [Chara braunii]